MAEQLTHEAVSHALKGIVARVLQVPEDTITDDARITDLSLVESIKLLRIAGRIERTFGIELDNEVLFRTGSLREIADEVHRLCLRGQQQEQEKVA
ncbi:acyl carrier protein [Actinomadura sp. ATCC 31491]|uniref:Acyl carrier protein n=1 Tax=Actinomadura luzonensis TaxID=2805427 RepID=A0ABT0G3D1_9ACTN|nr:acyl carrier protein [Actinomadura luzonensis]MCK2218638.1 acyl carrier protein [Actinomadura luzonensis]